MPNGVMLHARVNEETYQLLQRISLYKRWTLAKVTQCLFDMVIPDVERQLDDSDQLFRETLMENKEKIARGETFDRANMWKLVDGPLPSERIEDDLDLRLRSNRVS